MSDPAPRRIDEADAEGRLLGVIEISAAGDDGTATAVVHVESGPWPAGTGRRLMDTVMDSPEVQQAQQVTAVLPRGQAECLLRAQERLHHLHTRQAGASVIVNGSPTPL